MAEGDLDTLPQGQDIAALHEVAMAEERSAEQALARAILRGVVIAIPVAFVVLAGMMALAVGGQHPDWAAWLGMAGAVSVPAGAFFGGLAGFVANSHLLDNVDHHVGEMLEKAKSAEAG